MSLKRRNTSSPECEESPKRQRSELVNQIPVNENSSPYRDEVVRVDERPQLNTETGQSNAFPGLGSDETGDLFYGPANDGIDYLRMVRSEAKGIPQLLVAGSRLADLSMNRDNAEDEQDEIDEGGYRDYDGTYTAKQFEPSSPEESRLPLAQRYYYDSLLAHFNIIRATMKCIPPLSAIERLTSSQPISFPPDSKKAKQMWKECLLKKEPNPVQIACMDTSSIFQLIGLVAAHLGVLLGTTDLDLVNRFGSWVWAILGKCPDQGELMSEDISDLRQLAQRAIEVRNRLDEQRRGAQSLLEENGSSTDAASEEEGEAVDDLIVDIAAAKRRFEGNVPTAGDQKLQQRIDPTKSEKITILDMILLVIGEVYSQRDLLEARKPWEASYGLS